MTWRTHRSEDAETHTFTGEAGWVRLERRRPGHHVASLRLFVIPRLRGQGHGRALVREALDYAPTVGIHRVEATPYVDNHVSTRFFHSHPDFEIEGKRRKGGKRDSSYVDTWLYAWTT